MARPHILKGELNVKNCRYHAYLQLLFHIAFGNLFNPLLSHTASSVIMIVSSTIRKDYLEFV